MSEKTQFELPEGRLCAAGRALLGWSQGDLEAHSGVARKTISDFESGRRSLGDRTKAALFLTLSAEGVRISVNDKGEVAVLLTPAQ